MGGNKRFKSGGGLDRISNIVENEIVVFQPQAANFREEGFDDVISLTGRPMNRIVAFPSTTY